MALIVAAGAFLLLRGDRISTARARKLLLRDNRKLSATTIYISVNIELSSLQSFVIIDILFVGKYCEKIAK